MSSMILAAPTFEIPGATFTGLASPSRGATETSVWRVAIEGDEPFEAVVALPVGGTAAFEGGEPFTPPWAS